MLSAVAARKARLAQTQTQAPPQTTAASFTPPASTTPPPSESQRKPSSKRKPSAPAGNAAKKRKGQSRKASPGPSGRYFTTPDAFKTQEDIIVVAETDSDTSLASQDTHSEDDASKIPPAHLHSRPSGRRRSWSPSGPLPDSSDEESGISDEPVLLDVAVPTSDKPGPVAHATLSTFQPVLNQNVFHLTSSNNSLCGRTVVLLAASDTIALLGTYSISVLRGSVNLGGVPLNASSTSYSVFAPRSSPIPIIECLPFKTSSSDITILASLPHHVADAAKDYDAVIVLQDLHTGIEGLGKICRTFDGSFAPSRWHRDRLRFDLGLDTVYYVRFRINPSHHALSDASATSFPIKHLTSLRWTSLRLGAPRLKLSSQHSMRRSTKMPKRVCT